MPRVTFYTCNLRSNAGFVAKTPFSFAVERGMNNKTFRLQALGRLDCFFTNERFMNAVKNIVSSVKVRQMWPNAYLRSSGSSREI